MKLASAASVFVFLLVITARAEEAPLPKPRYLTLGGLLTAYSTASTKLVSRELGLSDEQRAAVKQLRQHFMQSAERNALREKSRYWQSQPWNEETYYNEGFKREKAFIETLNSNILETLDDVIDDRKKSKRLREILTQVLLKRCDFESVVRLNEIELSLDEYRGLLRRFAQTPIVIEPKAVLAYRAALKYMLSKKLSQEEIAEAAGKEFNGVLGAQEVDVVVDPPASATTRLLAMPQVQVELNLTTAQAASCSMLRKELTPHIQLLTRQANQRSDAITSEAKKLAKESQEHIDSAVESQLKPVQHKRLKQLLFQYYVRCQDMDSALLVAGIEQTKGNKIDETLWNDVEAEAFYLGQLEQLKRGMEVLASVIGEKRLEKLCGKLALSHSVQSLAPTKELKEREAKIRERVARGLIELEPKPRANPRRGR